nr:hypothetical protein [Tanacetum cinerariifolium]
MESLSPQVVVAAKLPILNPNEFYLWKIRIEQYFLMTNYSLWKVILNGDCPIPTRVVDGVVQPIASTTAEQRLAKKNELKARGTLLMALPDKHQLKFNIHKDAKSLIEAIEKRFGSNKETKKVQKTLLKQQYENFTGSTSESLYQIHDRLQKLISQLEILDLEDQSLDDLFNNLQIYKTEVNSSSTASHNTQNIAFVSSQTTNNTNKSVSAVTSVFAASTKPPASILPNVNNLSDAVECYNCHRRGHFVRECRSPRDVRNKDTQRRNVPVETSTSNAMVSQCNGSDSEVAPCSKAYTKACATLQSYYDKLTVDFKKSQFDVLSYKSGLESVKARLNIDADDAFDDKENESAVHVSPCSSDKPKKHDKKANREAKGKTVGPNSTNNTNSFNVASSFDNAVSPNFEIGEKSSFVDPSQYPDDPNMPALVDIVYLDDKENVGAEADFSNLETSITVSPIPTTKVHKDHPVTQIIGDLSSSPQTRSMARMVKEQGGQTQIKDEHFHTCFMVYQIDVKSAFLYKTIKEEVYVCQPPGFKDPDYPHKVYKVVKALYRLHQAPRAWYETLANYLLENGFQRGKIDQTLFIKKQKGNILLVQVYVDDIIFGSTYNELCKAFEMLMKDKFQISLMGELTFFFGLQVKQKDNGMFISQDKYLDEILRKFGLTDGKSASTPIDTEKPLLKDPDAKRVFRYLKGKPHLGLWYPKYSPFNLVAYSDSDYVGASLDRKSTIGVVAGNQPNSSAGIQGNFDADPQNIDADDAFDDKENESAVHVSLCSSDKPKKHDEKANRKAKGKTVRPNSTNNTNSFNVASSFDNAVSPNFDIGEKSSFVDPSQYPDDLNMPALVNIVYSDDKEDVGAEADFSNLETSITVSPIPTTKVHKDHPVTQIIGDLSSSPQTRSMARMVKEQDVKSAFLYETIKEEVYVYHPPGFKDPDYPHKVYVDDIIFGSTYNELCKAFEKLMKDKFQMSLMGELTFFLGLQVKQKDNGMFISQDKYVAEILRKFGLTDGKSACTPIDTEKPLLKDPDGEDVDVHIYSTLSWSTQPYMFRVKKFWTSVSIKKSNDVVRLQALIDRKKIFAELARMGCEKPSTKLTFYKAFFLAYWKFLIYTILQCMSAKRTAWNKFISSMASAVICLATDKISQSIKITKLKQRVRRLEKKRQFKSSRLKRLRGKIIDLDTNEDVTLADAEEDVNANIQGRLVESQATVYHLDLQHAEKVLIMQDIDKAEHAEVEEVIKVVTTAKLMTEVKIREKQDNTVMRYQALKRKPVTEAQAKKNMMIYLKNIAGFKMDFFQGMTYNDIRPIFEKHYNSIQAFLEKGEKEIEEEGNKIKGDSLNHDAVKKHRIDEEHMERSKGQIWIRKSQELEAIRILWSSHHNIHNYSDDSASGKEIPLDTLHSGTNVEQSLELMLFKTSRKYAKGLLLLVEDLMLLV